MQLRRMTRILLLCGLVFILSAGRSKAADDKVAEKPAPTDTRKESIANLESHIAQREQRLAEWGKDIVELDTRIEKRVDELVKMLSGLSDSEVSGGKVKKLKQDAIAGLKRAMDAYSGKRSEVAENIRSGDTAAQGDLGKFDERINKRIEQIAELTKSVPARQDAETYEYDGASYWNGYFFEDTRINEETKKNRRDPSTSKKSREKSANSLKQDIDGLDKRRSSLQNLLTKRKSTPAEIQLYTRELGKLDAYEDHLKEQLRDLTLTSVEGGQPIAIDHSHDITELLDDARRDLRDDVARLFRTYDQFAKGRTYVGQLKANLAARKELLEKTTTP
jgi:predicted  nucleic acid-binding Zn-ribbon protein